ncbi:MAG: hypothetical protein J1E85_00870 [Ruminococcus sp.]|nr:hypothetical protein [Ruminococcus sp.]
MKGTKVNGYRKKTQSQLLKEIDSCKSISQLFAIIQHENISLQMHSQSSASNITVRKLGSKEIIEKKDTPFERLKKQVRKAVEDNTYNS